MPNEDGKESKHKGLEDQSEAYLASDPDQVMKDNSSSPCEDQNGATDGLSQGRYVVDAVPPAISIVILQPEEIPNPEVSISKNAVSNKNEKIGATITTPIKKDFLARSESCHDECRICQQQTEEPLIDIGCMCRGELAKAHRSCIEIWFRTRGSNKCEICQQIATNVPCPESQSSTNYWVWRVDPAYGGRHGEHGRGCISPLWIAFAILIGGLLLDVLISVSLGVSALPVNIIIGILIVLGLGTAIRLALECCQDWTARRNRQRTDMTGNPGYRPSV